MEVICADKRPFYKNLNSMEATYYDHEFDQSNFKGERKDKTLKKIYMESRSIEEIQDQVAKLVKTPTIVSNRHRPSIIGQLLWWRKAVTVTAIVKCKNASNHGENWITTTPRHLWSWGWKDLDRISRESSFIDGGHQVSSTWSLRRSDLDTKIKSIVSLTWVLYSLLSWRNKWFLYYKSTKIATHGTMMRC